MKSFIFIGALFCALFALVVAYPFPEELSEGEDSDNELMAELEALVSGEADDNDLDYLEFQAFADASSGDESSGSGKKNKRNGKGKRGTGRPRRKTTAAPSV